MHFVIISIGTKTEESYKSSLICFLLFLMPMSTYSLLLDCQGIPVSRLAQRHVQAHGISLRTVIRYVHARRNAHGRVYKYVGTSTFFFGTRRPIIRMPCFSINAFSCILCPASVLCVFRCWPSLPLTLLLDSAFAAVYSLPSSACSWLWSCLSFCTWLATCCWTRLPCLWFGSMLLQSACPGFASSNNSGFLPQAC